MVRRGWSQLDVPTGWVQIVRGPRPKSVAWPRANIQPKATGGIREATRRSEAHRGGTTDEASLSPEAVVEVSLSKVAKLETALEVLGDTEGPVYEAMQAELKRAKSAAQLQPASVRLEHCRSFIERAKKRISDLEAEKAILEAELKEAEVRLVRLEAEVAAPPPAGSNKLSAGPILQQMVNKLQQEKDAFAEELHGPVERSRVRQRVSPSHIPQVVPPMPTLIPHDLSNWILDRHSDLQEAMSAGGHQASVGIDISSESRRRETCRIDRRHGTVTQWGFRGVRVGEAANPGPCSRRRRMQRRALQWSWDSDSESEDERNVAPRLEPEDGEQVLPPPISSPPSEGHPSIGSRLVWHPTGIQACCVASVPRSDSRSSRRCASRTLWGFR